VATTWGKVEAAKPEILVVAACGWGVERAAQEVEAVREHLDRTGAARVIVLDGSAYFNRPGPRLVDSLEVLVDKLERN